VRIGICILLARLGWVKWRRYRYWMLGMMDEMNVIMIFKGGILWRALNWIFWDRREVKVVDKCILREDTITNHLIDYNVNVLPKLSGLLCFSSYTLPIHTYASSST